jgi:hypothetical protein
VATKEGSQRDYLELREAAQEEQSEQQRRREVRDRAVAERLASRILRARFKGEDYVGMWKSFDRMDTHSRQ